MGWPCTRSNLVISRDANSKLRPEYIKNDPHGPVSKWQTAARYHSVITREKCTVSGVEKSAIDFLIISSDLLNTISAGTK